MSTFIRWGFVAIGIIAIIVLVILAEPAIYRIQGIGNPVVPNPPNANYSDYPMNLEMRGEMGINDLKVAMTHKVTYNGALKKYTYYYRVESKGNSVVLFEWDVLQTASDQVGAGSLLELVPGNPQEFTFYHASPPALLNETAAIYEKRDGKWVVAIRALQPGPWPSSKYLPIEKTCLPDKKGIE
jgi:hypothetical protein